MKTKVVPIVLALLALGASVQAQSEEEMKKMMDSMMQNIPEDQKAFIQQMMKKGQEADNRRQARKEQAQKEQRAKNQVAQKEAENDFYWRNTIATNTQGKFENWPHGKAVIKAQIFNRETKQFMNLELGTVSELGQVTIQLPKLDFRKWPRIPITKSSSEGDQMRQSSYELEYSNENVTYFSTRFGLGVYQGENKLGNFKIGNAIRPVVNLNAPCCFDKAGDGYSAHWVFMSQANSISGNNGIAAHDLTFQPGWNLVMVRVEGSKEESVNGTAGGPFWEKKYYSATTSMPSDAKYYFTSNQ